MPLYTTDTASAIVDTLLFTATRCRASDIHIEPQSDRLRIRLRVDGELSVTHEYALDKHAEILSRLKILAGLDIAEQRLPQDGQFTHATTHYRVSTCPTYYGEKMALRLLCQSTALLPIDALGFLAAQHRLFMQAIEKPQGLILVTGPTGAGKTATLYAALSHLNHAHKNIMSIEDPIEITLPGMNQVAVSPKSGLTFARALRAFLRQDPDVLMIGEIRDEETADIACKAALSGHLVFSTLHTNSAVDTVHRLLQMGLKPYHLAAALSLIVAQRLVRKSTKGDYVGRTGIFEVLPIDAGLKHAIEQRASSTALQQWMQKQGYHTLAQAAHIQCAASITDKNECLRVIG